MIKINICEKHSRRRESKYKSPDRSGSKPSGTKDSREACAWGKGKKKEMVGDKCDEVAGDKLYEAFFIRLIQDFGFDLE